MEQNTENPTPVSPEPQQPAEPSKEAKQWAMFCHLSAIAMLLAIPFAHILGPLIIWLIKKDDYPFVREQGREALNFQISATIYALLLSPTICIAGIWFFLIIPLFIADLVFAIIAAISASDGKAYRYPCTIRLLK